MLWTTQGWRNMEALAKARWRGAIGAGSFIICFATLQSFMLVQSIQCLSLWLQIWFLSLSTFCEAFWGVPIADTTVIFYVHRPHYYVATPVLVQEVVRSRLLCTLIPPIFTKYSRYIIMHSVHQDLVLRTVISYFGVYPCTSFVSLVRNGKLVGVHKQTWFEHRKWRSFLGFSAFSWRSR